MFLSSSVISPAGLPLARQTSKAARFLGGKVAISRASRQFMGVSAGLFDGIGSWLSGGTDKKEGKNDSVLKSARKARAGCPLAPKDAPEGLEIATFAGGCFWGLELAFQRVVGVTNTSVGYTAGHDPAPTYESVCSGRTGHTEAVQVYYNPSECSYESLLQEFFSKVDPTTLNRQGNDRGTQYRSGIYYHTEEQKKLAEQWIEKVNAELASGSGQLYGRTVWGDKVVAELEPAGDYYLAEKYHQQYLSRGGRFGLGQSAEKGCKDPIRCYG